MNMKLCGLVGMNSLLGKNGLDESQKNRKGVQCPEEPTHYLVISPRHGVFSRRFELYERTGLRRIAESDSPFEIKSIMKAMGFAFCGKDVFHRDASFIDEGKEYPKLLMGTVDVRRESSLAVTPTVSRQHILCLMTEMCLERLRSVCGFLVGPLSKYVVCEIDEERFNPTVFSSDSREMLKVWMDCMGFSLGKMLYDSYRFEDEMPGHNYGAMRIYELKK